MRKLFILGLFSLLGGLIVAFFYYSQQAREIPRWYQIRKEVKPLMKSEKRKLKEKVFDFEQREQIKLQLSSGQVNDLIKLILVKELGDKDSKGIPDGIQAKIADNQMEVGGIINLANLEQENLSAEHREILAKIIKNLRQFANRDIYLGVQGRPILNGDRLELSSDGLVKIGNLQFTKDDIAKLTGLSREKIQQKLSLKLKSIKISQISIDQDKLNLILSRR